MFRRVSALLIVTVLVAACGDTITEPVADDDLLTSAMGPAGKGGQGWGGVRIVTSPFLGITHQDDDGDACQVLNYDRLGDDSSDWMRISKRSGTRYLHIQDEVASMRITMADGSVFVGEGKWSMNWHFNQLGWKGSNMSKAHGFVSDGTTTFEARCSYVRTSSGKLNRDISVW
jgi:hypothetical protein